MRDGLLASLQGTTYEGWLGEENTLGQNIMKRKYVRGDESFPEWLNRVSGGDEDLAQLIFEKKLLFGGRTMANRGTETRASYFNCFTGDTRILTSEGIKPLQELCGKSIKVLSNSSWKDATVQSFGRQCIRKLRIQKSGLRKEIKVTGDHLWIVVGKDKKLTEVRTEDLVPGMKLANSVMKCYRAYKPSPFGVAHGFHYGDGDHQDKRSIRTNICEGKEELLPYYMPDTLSEYEGTKIVCSVPYFFNEKPSLKESPSYLYGWLAGYFAADGSVETNGTCVICSTNRDNLEVVQDVLCVLGLPVGTIRFQDRVSNLTGKIGRVYILTLPRYYLNENFFILSKHRERFLSKPFAKPKQWVVEEVTEVVGEEEVYCAVVPETHTFTLDNNVLTHNCYSRGFVEDDYRDIMQAAVDIGMTFKAQGGQGISLSKLRPKGSPIGKDYTSDGIIPFMKIYNEVTAGTSQGGARKGALLLSLDARHKEAETFIRIKSQEGLIEKANLSLEIDDEFMEAVQRFYDTGEVVTLHEKRNYSGHIVEYDVIPIHIFEALVDNCWDWADPAALFVNRLRNYNLMQYDDDYVIETVNPCGEQPLPRSGACCLASLNLSAFVKEPYTEDAYFDSGEFVRAVKVGVRSLDRLIDENFHRHPLKEQQEMSYNYRNIGLGVFGYATMLMKLGLTYGSEDALSFTDSIFGLMFRAAVIESNTLAAELGPYPKYKDCVWDSDIIRVHFPQEEIERMKETGLRNCSLISIAPTGSIATMLGESGGCEPEFAMKYTRRTVGMTEGEDTYYEVDCKPTKEYKEINGTDDLPPWFVASQDIPWQNRIMTQAIMQKHVDTGISSTVNLPNSATKQDVAGLYLMAWKLGLKGVTIFRDGCKRFPILSTNTSSDGKTSSPAPEAGHECEALVAQGATEAASMTDLPRGYIIDVSDALVGKKRKLVSGCGSLHVTAFFDPKTGDLMETFLNRGSAGGCENSYIGLSRVISMAARAGCKVQDIADQLLSCGVCPSYAVRRATRHDTSPGACCPIAIGKALLEMWQEFQKERGTLASIPAEGKSGTYEDTDPNPFAAATDNAAPKCPQCGAEIVFEEGCANCKNCGWSKCN